MYDSINTIRDLDALKKKKEELNEISYELSSVIQESKENTNIAVKKLGLSTEISDFIAVGEALRDKVTNTLMLVPKDLSGYYVSPSEAPVTKLSSSVVTKEPLKEV